MRKRILIKGKKVHNVGYRPFLLGIAESLEIERFFADNILINETQAVEIFVDTSGDKVNSFIEMVIKKYPNDAVVDEVETEDYDGRVMKRESYYRYLTAMQLSKIATYGGQMLEKQDKTIEEVRATREEVRATREEVRATREEIKEEIKTSSEKIKDEIKGLRDDLKSHFDERLTKIERDVIEIKNKLGMSG